MMFIVPFGHLVIAIETTQAGLWLRDFGAIWAGVAPAVWAARQPPALLGQVVDS
jgi:hypothetical protein